MFTKTKPPKNRRARLAGILTHRNGSVTVHLLGFGWATIDSLNAHTESLIPERHRTTVRRHMGGAA